MNNYTKEETNRLLEKLERSLKDAPNFTPDDVENLHRMVNAWKGWVALGRGARWLITALGLIAAAVASWAVLAGAFKDWIRS